MKLAPIVLFVYNRPELALKTLEHLKLNVHADKSELFIFSDGPKVNADEDSLKKIHLVREVIRKDKWCKNVHIVESKINLGLADSIINGVTEIVNKFGKIIVLEDDLLTSIYFLEYMNKALDKYEDIDKVYVVIGYNYPIKIKTKEKAFFSKATSCLGWGTWKASWDNFKKSPDDYVNLYFDKKLSYRFDLDGSYPFTKMLKLQMEENVDSWAIRWWWAIFKNKGLSLFPSSTLIAHIGFNLDATHTKSEIKDYNKYFNINNNVVEYPEKIKGDRVLYSKQKEYLKTLNKIGCVWTFQKYVRSVLKKFYKTKQSLT